MHDAFFRKHLTFVFNQILQIVRKEGISKAALEKAGKMLFRLYLVYKAYRRKKKKLTTGEWIKQLDKIARELQDVIG